MEKTYGKNAQETEHNEKAYGIYMKKNHKETKYDEKS